jgi:hypothetical protein
MMLKNVNNFDTFSKYWEKFKSYAVKEGINLPILYKTLAGVVELEEGIRVASCMQHWLTNHLDDLQRLEFVTSLNSPGNEEKEEIEIEDDFASYEIK